MRSSKGIEIKIIVLLVLGLLVIVSGGVYSFYNLKRVVTSISNEKVKQTGLGSIQQLTTNIERAENLIRLYGITSKPSYLWRYRTTVAEIDSVLNNLIVYYPENEWFKNKIDTIHIIVNRKKELWSQIGDIWEGDISSEDISEISKRIPITDTIEERRFLSSIKLFKKKEKEQHAQAQEEANKLSKELVDRLSTLEKEEKLFVYELTNQEQKMAHNSILLSESFIDLISQLEDYEISIEQERIKNADKLTSEAYQLLSILSLAGICIGLFGLIMLITYIRKGKAYNKLLLKSQKEAERLTKSKELFMAKVSHEIRTPLNAITGFIRQIMANPTDKHLQDNLKIIHAASDQLIHLINDVLDFNKLQTGKLELTNEHFLINDTIHNVCDLYNQLAHENGNEILTEYKGLKSEVLYCDKYRFQQIIYNLLSNAVKFTKNGTIKVVLSVNEIKEKNLKQVQLQVEDNGLGIDKLKLNSIFEEYNQADNNIAINYRGTGLGLSIVKKLVELFNGTITLHSEPGKGTTVNCQLYFQQGEKSKIEIADSPSQITSLSKELNILIADDEPYNQNLIAAILKKHPAKYSFVNNGLEAIEAIKENNFSVVLMDIRMPVIDGITATKFVRDTLKLSKTKLPIFGITADATQNSKDEWLKWCNGIIVKPFTEEELIAALQNTPIPEKDTTAENQQNQQIESEVKIDLSQLVSMAANDIKFIHEMVQQFIDSTKQGLYAMQQALDDKQYSEIMEIAHKLASPCRHMGVTNLLINLKELENNAEKEDDNYCTELLNESVEIFEEVERLIPLELSRLTEVKP